MPNSKRKCRYCAEYFDVDTMVRVPLGYFCTMDHAAKHGQKKALKKKEAEYNRETKARKQALKTNSELLKEAQRDFNKYIRVRGRYNGQTHCICCEKPLNWNLANSIDAGHFVAISRNEPLRFNLNNVWPQLKQCNKWQNGDSGMYEQKLRQAIGDEKVDYLLNYKGRSKYSNEYLERIKRIFRKKTRMLEKRMANA